MKEFEQEDQKKEELILSHIENEDGEIRDKR
jgi:hypothetical protein